MSSPSASLDEKRVDSHSEAGATMEKGVSYYESDDLAQVCLVSLSGREFHPS